MRDSGVISNAWSKTRRVDLWQSAPKTVSQCYPKRDRKRSCVCDELTAKELTLAELREVRLRSQAALAAKLGIKQSAVSRLERRADMYLSTLNSLIEAMGGSLQIIAQFPDRPAVRIKQFRALD